MIEKYQLYRTHKGKRARLALIKKGQKPPCSCMFELIAEFDDREEAYKELNRQIQEIELLTNNPQ